MNSGSCVSSTWCFARVDPSSTLMSAPWSTLMFPPKRKLWRGLGSQLDLSSAADRLLSVGECVVGSREWPGVNADTSPRFGARLGDRCASPGPMRGVMAGEGRGGAALSVLSTPSLSKRPLRRGVYAGGEPLRNAPSFFTRSPSITSHPEPPSILFAPPPSPPGTNLNSGFQTQFLLHNALETLCRSPLAWPQMEGPCGCSRRATEHGARPTCPSRGKG
jgi:hypothetical protein